MPVSNKSIVTISNNNILTNTNKNILTKYPQVYPIITFKMYVQTIRSQYIATLKTMDSKVLIKLKSDLNTFFVSLINALDAIVQGFMGDIDKIELFKNIMYKTDSRNRVTNSKRRMTERDMALITNVAHPHHGLYSQGIQGIQGIQQIMERLDIMEMRHGQSAAAAEREAAAAAAAAAAEGEAAATRKRSVSGRRTVIGGGYKSIQLFNIEFKKLLIKVDNINDNIKLSINEKKIKIKKLFNQFEKKIKTQINKIKKKTTNTIKLLKLTKSKPKSRKKTVSKTKKSKPKSRKKTVSKPKKKIKL